MDIAEVQTAGPQATEGQRKLYLFFGIDRTSKEATVKRFHYESYEQLRTHLADFMVACNFARRLKTLSGLTPYAYTTKNLNFRPRHSSQIRSTKGRA